VTRGWVQVLLWAGYLAVLTIVLWVWWGDRLNVGSLGAAAIVTAAIALLAAALGRRRPRQGAHVEPDLSVGASIVGIALSGMLFGAEFGLFLVVICAGLLVAGVAILWNERRGAG
jgi:hypothetical protein